MPDIGATLGRIKRLPVVNVVVGVQERYGAEGAGLLASAITYQAFFSLFPLILVGFSAVGFIFDDPEAQRRFIESAAGSVPGLQSLLGDSLDVLVDARAATGIVGILGFAWKGTAVVRASGRALTQIFRIEIESDNAIKQTGWAVGSLAMLGLLATVAMGVTFGGSSLPPGNVGSTAGLILLGAIVDVALFAVAYRILTRGDGPSFRAVLPGAAFAGIGWTVLKLIGSWYARRTVADAQAVYGTFAAAIGILVMLSVGARLFMYGAVIDALRMSPTPSPRSPATTTSGTSEIDRNHRQDEEVKMGMAENENGERQRSTMRLVRDIADDTRALVRQEVALAKHEVTEAVMAKMRGALAFATAAVFGLMVLVFVALSAEAALGGMMAGWAARLIVAAGCLLLAAGAAGFGVIRLKKPSITPTETVRTVKEDVEWAKAQLKR